MKKLIVAALAFSMALAPMQVHAKGRDAALILGGILGGLVIGGAIGGNQVHAAPPQPVYDPEPYYRQVCDTVNVRRYDRYNHIHYYTREKRCYWVRY